MMAARLEPVMAETHPKESASSGGSLELAPGLRVHESEVRFSASRSGGPGGQNVNKVSTRMELRLAVGVLGAPGRLSERALERFRRLAAGRINREDELVLTSGRFRSQSRNRQACLDVLRAMILEARVAPRPRRPTKPSRGAVQRRLREKKARGESKQRRRPPTRDE